MKVIFSNNTFLTFLMALFLGIVSTQANSFSKPSAFPAKLPEEKPDRPLSAAMHRFYDQIDGTGVEANELFSRYKIHDPYPLVYKGKIYLYYKSDLNWEAPRPWRAEKAHGLAIADHPLGPFDKHPLNPVLNSGHETGYWPWKEGIATMVILNGPELNTVQYAPDGVNFEIASIAQDLPIAPGPYVPDAFVDNRDGRGITWGLCHLNPGGGGPTQPSILARFDCDLSLDHHYPEFKENNIRLRADYYFEQGVSPEQRKELRKRDLKEPDNRLE